MGIGQKMNKPCWCGSGKKYKKCHLNRENLSPVNPWEAAKGFRDIFSKGLCSVPESYRSDCSDKIIKAHTVPKSSSLKAIAKDGHVYGLNCSIEALQKHNGRVVCELIGVNKASTFSGFCSVHDAPLFKAIETEAFSNTPEQCFLLAYRAHAREAYTKKAMSDVIANIMGTLDRGKPHQFQVGLQANNALMDVGAQAALNDIEHHKRCFDEGLVSDDYSSIRAVSFKTDTPPPVMASGATNLTHDFEGNRVQDLMDLEVIPDCWSVTSFYDGASGWIVFSWLDSSHESCEKVIKTLLNKPKEDILAYLTQYLFDKFENFFISPDWWDNMDQKEQEKALGLVSSNVSMEEDLNGNGIKQRILGTDFPMVSDIEFVNWSIHD